jgi:hypothetical protein
VSFMKRCVPPLMAVVATLVGCADAPPAPAGKDTYLLSASTTWTFKAGGELLPALYTKADAFCRERGKVIDALRPAPIASGQ